MSDARDIVERLPELPEAEWLTTSCGYTASQMHAYGIECRAPLLAELDRLRAALSQQAGWKLVPVEPTPEMVEAMARAWQQAVERDDPNECIAEYRAALAASPQAPTTKANVEAEPTPTARGNR